MATKSSKITSQLGITHSQAWHKLKTDLLFSLALKTGHINCFRCSKKLSRDDFSIEHKTPWLHSDDPKELFFNLENITFSHWTCNIKSSRRQKKYHSRQEQLDARNKRSRIQRKQKLASESPEERKIRLKKKREWYKGGGSFKRKEYYLMHKK